VDMVLLSPWDLQTSCSAEATPVGVATALSNIAEVLPELKLAEAEAILPLVERLGKVSSEECRMAALKAIIAVARVSADMVKETGGVSVLTLLKSSTTSWAVRKVAAMALDALGSSV